MRRPVPGWAVAFLRAGRAARLGTADTAGQPLVVPVCYVFDGKRCYVPIDAKPKRDPARPLKRLRNIEENPRVSLVVDRWDEDWSMLRWVIIQGRADVVRPGPVLARAASLLVAKYPQYGALGIADRFAAAIRITPERLIAWSWR